VTVVVRFVSPRGGRARRFLNRSRIAAAIAIGCAFQGLTGCAGGPSASDEDSSGEAGSASNNPGSLTSATKVTAVHVWLTTPDLTQRLSQRPDIALSAAGTATVTLDRTKSLQTLDGFGAAFTDTSNWLIGSKLNTSARTQVMADLFSPSAGLGLSVMRIPMGSSDFAVNGVYSYDDAADTDALPNFSTKHDDAYVIPVILQAQTLNSGLRLFANPWSPPGWMKTNNSMFGGWNGSGLRADKYQAYANYFVKFLQQYSTKGVKVWGITPQNEPNQDPSSYPGSYLSAANQAKFIASYLGPSLDAAGLKPAILGGDVSVADSNYAATLFANAAVAGRLYGTAWHCYQDVSSYAGGLSAIHNLSPSKPLYGTECSTGAGGYIAGDTTQKTLVATNNWASAMVLWNLALDRSGGPKMGVGCEGCTGLVTIDQRSGEYEYTLNYYQLGQFSKFVRPGAVRIGFSDGGGIWAQAYRNADGTETLVAYNTKASTTAFSVNWSGDGKFSYSLPGNATVTFTTAATAEGAFNLVGTNSGRCLDVPNGTVGAGLQVWDCVGNQNQRIKVNASGELRVLDRCLAAEADRTTAGTRVILWPCNGKPSQKWTFNADGTITNALSNLALNVSYTAAANGTAVNLATRNAGSTQLWSKRTQVGF
jgi:glucosylceramidase